MTVARAMNVPGHLAMGGRCESNSGAGDVSARVGHARLTTDGRVRRNPFFGFVYSLRIAFQKGERFPDHFLHPTPFLYRVSENH